MIVDVEKNGILYTISFMKNEKSGDMNKDSYIYSYKDYIYYFHLENMHIFTIDFEKSERIYKFIHSADSEHIKMANSFDVGDIKQIFRKYKIGNI